MKDHPLKSLTSGLLDFGGAEPDVLKSRILCILILALCLMENFMGSSMEMYP